MASGGHREGQVGKSYGNRSDLTQAPNAATGQQYGQAKQQLDAQKVIPLPLAAPAGGTATSNAVPAGVAPGQIDFAGPSLRPDEPVTHGLPSGPGGGPEVLGNPFVADEIGAQLYALYRQNPNNDLLSLLELHDRGY